MHRVYEIDRLNHLHKFVKKCLYDYHLEDNTSNEIVSGTNEILRTYKTIVHGNDTLSSEDMCHYVHTIVHMCNTLIHSIDSIGLPPVKPRWADLTDAGPGVGISNFEVRFRDAELARLHNSDYRIRLHRSRGDSRQNEAERTNSAIQDSVIDGATIPWESEERFAGMTSEEITNMSVKEYEIYESDRMKRNAWSVANEVARRIDGAPVLSEYLHCKVSNNIEDQFFFNGDILKQYKASTHANLPGIGYIDKIQRFYKLHYNTGELYMEYLKGSCVDTNMELGEQSCEPGSSSTGQPTDDDNELCNYCASTTWIGPKFERIPQPVPGK